MKLRLGSAGIYDYFKKTKRERLLTGSLLIISGLVASSIGVIHFFNSSLEDGLSMSTFNTLIADTTYSLLLIVPSLVLFSIGYMLLEGHSLGWKLSLVACVAAVLATVGKYANLELAVTVAVLSGLAATLEIRSRRRATSELKDSPTVTENLAKFGLRLSGIVCMCILVGMIVYTTVRASPYISWDLFTNVNWSWANAARVLAGVSPGPMGGLLGYAMGSLLLVAVCEFIAFPLGLGAAIYLAEYSSQNKLTDVVRFFIETLAGIPSVVIGLVGLAVFVEAARWGPSLLGGGLALAFMILPWNIRIAEEAMRSVPSSYREASYALGATQWQTSRGVVLFAALPGIITGFLLGVGAALGETIVVAMTAGDAPSGPQVLPNLSQIFASHTQIPTLTVFIWRTNLLLALNVAGASGSVTDLVFKEYGVALAGSFVLIVIYLAICAIALVARNYLNKKITGK